MRILMVTNTYAPARNGVAAWVSLSVRELRARGHEVDVLTYAHDRREPGQPGMFELPAWAGLDSDFRVTPVLSGLPPELDGRTWDIVHVHHPVFLGPAGVALGRARGAKVIFTCHSVYADYLDEYYWGIGRVLRSSLDRRIGRFVNGCDAVFAPSSCVTRWLRSCGAEARIELLEAPADTGRIHGVSRETARTELGVGERPLAFYVGRIADEKRVQDLVREFRGVLAEAPDALLALGGSGRRVPAVRRDIARWRLPDSVRLLGPLDAAALGRWYSAADISVSASRSETGPLTVVEAMSCACPTVALRAPGFEDRIVDGVNGLLVHDRPGALGQAMARVLTDPALRADLARGASLRAGRYTPDAATDAMLSVYESLLA